MSDQAREGARFPPPDATREQITRWYEEHRPPPEPPHEAPPVANGPSIVCNACGLVRVSVRTPFCKGCLAWSG